MQHEDISAEERQRAKVHGFVRVSMQVEEKFWHQKSNSKIIRLMNRPQSTDCGLSNIHEKVL
ncbi:MAG: hypothetical protein ACLTGA_12750 [Roseburia sp.]